MPKTKFILASIEISGAESADFLNRMLCNDVQKLESDHAQYTALCNPKGRTIANGFLVRHDESFSFLISQDLLTSTAARLRMFVMRSKVNIEEDRETCWSLSNTESKTKLPLGSNNVFIRQTDTLEDQSEQLIDFNIALVSQQCTEMFVPQMLNMDQLSGISFKKGCYPGQEIIARMHFLGKLKQRCFKFSSETPQLAVGTPLYDDTKLAGHVVHAHNNNGLCSIRIKEQQQWTLATTDNDILKIAT
ncbi:MAG: CAF17-like 4Fe-4S cluster assembly/insertion protein YgfZ [bacterium]